MKKSFIYTAAAVMALVACTQEITVPEVIDNTDDVVVKMVEIEFSANLENPTDPDSKATINLSDGTASWQDGTDKIAIHTHNGSLATLTYNKSSNSFKGSISDGDSIDDNAIAYYPASIAISGDAAHVNLPTSYATADLAAQSFPLRGLVNTSTNSIDFKYLGSMLKITATYMRDEIDQVEINLPLNITGTLPVTGTDDAPSVTPASGSSTITIGVGSLDRNPGTGEATFLFPILAGDYSGLSFTFKSSTLGVYGEKATPKVQSFDRKKVYRMASFVVPGLYAALSWDYNDSDYTKGTPLFKTGDGWYVAKSVNCASEISFKFYENGSKSGDWGRATGSSSFTMSVDNIYTSSTYAESGNGSIKIPTGTYDLYFSPSAYKFMIKNPGATQDKEFVNIHVMSDIIISGSDINAIHLWGASSPTSWPGSRGQKTTIDGIPYYVFSIDKSSMSTGNYKFIIGHANSSWNGLSANRFDFRNNNLSIDTSADNNYYLSFTSVSYTGYTGDNNTGHNENFSTMFTDPTQPQGRSNWHVVVGGTDAGYMSWDNSTSLVLHDVVLTASDDIKFKFNNADDYTYGLASSEAKEPGSWFDVTKDADANTSAFNVTLDATYSCDVYLNIFSGKAKVVKRIVVPAIVDANYDEWSGITGSVYDDTWGGYTTTLKAVSNGEKIWFYTKIVKDEGSFDFSSDRYFRIYMDTDNNASTGNTASGGQKGADYVFLVNPVINTDGTTISSASFSYQKWETSKWSNVDYSASASRKWASSYDSTNLEFEYCLNLAPFAIKSGDNVRLYLLGYIPSQAQSTTDYVISIP